MLTASRRISGHSQIPPLCGGSPYFGEIMALKTKNYWLSPYKYSPPFSFITAGKKYYEVDI